MSAEHKLIGFYEDCFVDLNVKRKIVLTILYKLNLIEKQNAT